MVQSKPLQKKSWSEKVEGDYKDFKNNIDYFIGISAFKDTATAETRIAKLSTLYNVYNSQYPPKWFDHITAPYKSGELSWPAKIRPMNIIRPNIEFLRGEYPKRPFNYQVSVRGEDGYNAFLEGKKKAVYSNISQMFINELNQNAEATGLETGIESKDVELPPQVVEKFTNTFKNILAIDGQNDLKLIMDDQYVREKLMECLKDWLIAGEVRTYKNVRHDTAIYERVNPMELDGDKSPGVKYLQDGDWVVRRMLMTVSDVVDRFYETLKPRDISDLEEGHYRSAANFSAYLRTSDMLGSDKVPVYHVCWRSMEKFGIVTYPNFITGSIEEKEVNETYVPIKELSESIQWFWRTKWLEGYRIGDNLYAEMQPVRYAPASMNNLSKTQGPYNGCNFSDENSDNISIVKLGLPFQIMYMICNFTLERTIAKSRGKIVLMDINAIPRGPGHTLETFLEFSETQGWGFINRTQSGVDSSFNQYQVLDLNLFEHIKNLIDIMEYCKTQYEDQIGVSKQAKAKTTSQESATGVSAAIYQTSVITEMIYADFDNFVKRELQGLLDCSQISNIRGKRASWVGSDGRTELLNINPEEYSSIELGLVVTDSVKENDALKKMKDYIHAFAQNGISPSTILAMQTADNIATLQSMLVSVENKEKEYEAQMAESEQQAEAANLVRSQNFEELKMLLEIDKLHEQFNRQEDLVLLQGDINMALAEAERGAEAGTDGSVEATKAMMDYQNERDKIAQDNERKNKETDAKLAGMKAKQERETKADERKAKQQEKESKIKEQIANKKMQMDEKKANAAIAASKKKATKK